MPAFFLTKSLLFRQRISDAAKELFSLPLGEPVEQACANTGDHAVDDDIRTPGEVGLAHAGIGQIHRAVDYHRAAARFPLGGHAGAARLAELLPDDVKAKRAAYRPDSGFHLRLEPRRID